VPVLMRSTWPLAPSRHTRLVDGVRVQSHGTSSRLRRAATAPSRRSTASVALLRAPRANAYHCSTSVTTRSARTPQVTAHQRDDGRLVLVRASQCRPQQHVEHALRHGAAAATRRARCVLSATSTLRLASLHYARVRTGYVAAGRQRRASFDTTKIDARRPRSHTPARFFTLLQAAR
jgi:hypothetical protein